MNLIVRKLMKLFSNLFKGSKLNANEVVKETSTGKYQQLDTFLDEVSSKLPKAIFCSKTSEQSVGNSYVNCLWENAIGDTEYIKKDTNNYNFTINDDFKYVVIITNINTSADTTFYQIWYKNDKQYSAGWNNTVSFHNKAQVIPVSKGDVLRLSVYSSASCKINKSENTQLMFIGLY